MIEVIKKSKNFLFKYYKTILIVFGSLFVFYWLIFILTPAVKMSEQSVEELKKIDEEIETLNLENQILQSEIVGFQNKILNVNENLEEIKDIKESIGNDYGKKITDARSYNHDELVRFLSERYNDNRIY